MLANLCRQHPLTNGKYNSFDERIQLIIQDLIEGYHISINHALVLEELLEKSFLNVSI
jgi:retron-type reverse transcriptase